MQDIFYIILLSLGSFAAIFILTKIVGYREMSQLSMFDYVNSITIGSIAAEMATSLDENYMAPLTALVVYAVCALLVAWATSKSMGFRKFIEGKPLILLDKGELYRENLKKAKMDIQELLVQCRVKGYFDISKLETIVLEGDGKVSILPKATERPLTPSDMSLAPQEDYLVANVILDGQIMHANLRHTGNDEKWLRNQIKGQGVEKVEDVLLATCDVSNQLTVFRKNSRKETEDILM